MDKIRIGGYVSQSLIDFPGKITAVIFTQGCNFRCGFCHNPLLVLPELFQMPIPQEEILESINNAKSWLDAVTISGGEPTIQNGLPRFIREIKKTELLVKLDTNGSNPEMLKQLLDENLLDNIAVDIKTILKKEAYNNIIGIEKKGLIKNINLSLELIRNAGISYQLRTTVVPGHHTEEIISILKEQFGAENYVLQEYRPGATVDSFRNIE